MKSKSHRSNFLSKAFPCSITLTLLAAMPAARAADGTWTGGTSATWATTTNWLGGTVAGSLSANADIATFNLPSYTTPFFAPTAVNDYFVGGLIFGASSGPITMSTGGGNSRLNVGSSGIQMDGGSGAVIIGSALAHGINFVANQSWTNNSSSLLSVSRAGVDSLAAVGTYTLTINGSGSGGVTVSSNLADVNILADANRKTAVIINSSGGATNFNASSTYSGGTTLTAGLLQIGGNSAGTVGAITTSNLGTGSLALNGGTLSSGSGAARTILNATTIGGNVTLGNASNNGVLTLAANVGLSAGTRTLTTASNVVFAGVVSNGDIIKEGAGTLALNANSSTVAVAVNSGTLAGTGTVGATSIATGNLSIGALAGGVGAMNYTSLSLGSASTFIYQMTGGGITADLGDIAGALTINTSAILDLVELGTYTAGNKFTLFAYDGLLTGNFSGLLDGANFTDDLANSWVIDYNDTSNGLNGGAGTSFVTITAIPEPNAAALLGGLGMLALLRRRRA